MSSTAWICSPAGGAILDLFEEAEERLMGVAGGAPQIYRQDRLRAFQGLDLTLLVHAKDDHILRRALVKPNHVADLFHKKRIGGESEGLPPVGFDARKRA